MATITENLLTIQSSLADIKTAIVDKGVNVDGDITTYADKIASIETGGGGGGGTSWTGHADADGLRAIGWTDDDIAYYQANGVNWNEEDDECHKVTDDNKALYGVLTTSNIYIYRDRIVYLPKINTSRVKNMGSMFAYCYSLVAIPLLDTGSATSMNGMFTSCFSLVSIPQLDTSSVTNMNEMFYQCYSLVNIPLLDTSEVTSMNGMFYRCFSLTSIPLLDTSNVTDMGDMFHHCSSLTSIPLLDMVKVESVYDMFYYSQSITYIKLSELTLSLDLSEASKLTKESLLYIIDNEAATSAITITLHSYAYSRLAEDADIVEELTYYHPNISLASA